MNNSIALGFFKPNEETKRNYFFLRRKNEKLEQDPVYFTILQNGMYLVFSEESFLPKSYTVRQLNKKYYGYEDEDTALYYITNILQRDHLIKMISKSIEELANHSLLDVSPCDSIAMILKEMELLFGKLESFLTGKCFTTSCAALYGSTMLLPKDHIGIDEVREILKVLLEIEPLSLEAIKDQLALLIGGEACD